MFRIPSLAKSDLVCLASGILFAASTLVWVWLDRAPPNWDDAWYLANSLTVYDALAHDGVAGYLTKLNSVFGFKAPLIAALPAPFYVVFGRRWHAAYLVNIVSMLVLFAALYRIARRWWNSRTALLAIAVAGAMPLLYGLARWYLVEYVLTALVTAAVCVLVESDGLKRDRHAVLFGAICGIGLLLKITFPLFVGPVFMYVWMVSGRRARPMLLAAIPCLALALPWYAGHLRPALAFALGAGFGAPGAMYGMGPVLSFVTIATYLSRVAANGVSYYFVVLALLLSLWAIFRRQTRALISGLTPAGSAVLATWLLPFAIFVFADNKDIRLIAPILPAAALMVAFLLDFTLPRSRAGAAAAALLLAFPLLQMLAISFGIPYSAAGAGYARRFSRQSWPHDEILNLIAANSSFGRGEKGLLLVGADRPAFNANNIELTAMALRLPFNVETTAHEKDRETLRQRLAQASFFVFEEGGPPESPAFNPYASDLAQSVANDRRYQEVPYGRRLPDGGIARIYKNLAPGRHEIEGRFVKSGHEAPAGPGELAADFGGVLALGAMSVIAGPHDVAVKVHWHSLKPADRDYWCFTHLIDSNGRIVAQLDHQLLGGEPPLRSWRAGDRGEEEIHLRLPAGAASTGLRLRFGIYDPPSGERLKVRILQGAGELSVTDQSTALLRAN